MRTYVISGSASGMGAAMAAPATKKGHRVVRIDLRDPDVVCGDAVSQTNTEIYCDPWRAWSRGSRSRRRFAGSPPELLPGAAMSHMSSVREYRNVPIAP